MALANGNYFRLSNVFPEISLFVLSNFFIFNLGDAFACTTTEGVLVYALDSAGIGGSLRVAWPRDSSHEESYKDLEEEVFNPTGIDDTITPTAARDASLAGEHAVALDAALRLRQYNLIKEVIEAVPTRQNRS
ncbi:unnamed protein product [Protopolystoma xenopodis]|uniref:Uncharacterized protein n=1 Tax=Protopolystoma xenopodis TaxID=117903 RepID=A0A448WIY3_9PLAT|nr:unnamed protein product [Protopolystoma xenopodis]